MAPAEDKADDGAELNFGDAIDMSTFGQILEMDDAESNEFSSSIVFDFFTQAEDTFSDMDSALQSKDLKKLSELGHFLKGSSATLGLVKVRDGCEKIQRYGKNENEDGSAEPDSELCLKKIGAALKTVKTDFVDVEGKLRRYYEKSDADKEGA